MLRKLGHSAMGEEWGGSQLGIALAENRPRNAIDEHDLSGLPFDNGVSFCVVAATPICFVSSCAALLNYRGSNDQI